MGRELFYCGTCGKRLSGDDVEHGMAVRSGGNFFCVECAPSEVKTPVPRKASVSEGPGEPLRKSNARLSLPGGGTRRISTTRIPSADPPPRGRMALLVGGSLGAMALLVLVIFLFSGGKREPASEPAAGPKIEAKIPPAPPKPPLAEKIPPAAPPSDERRGKETEEALKELQGRSREACGREEFGKALTLWEEARPRFETDAWKRTVESEVRTVQETAAALWKSLRESTPPASREALRDRIGPWGMPGIARELEEMLRPKEPSPALKAYREAWARALALAAGGDWDAAIGELGEPEDAEARAEAEADRALFGKVKELPAAPEVERGRTVSLKYARTPAEYEEVRGIVVQADDQRVEIDLGEKKSLFVEWRDLSPASRAALLAGAGADARALAALCLIGGDAAAAGKIAPRDAVPPRYWERAPAGGAAPPPRDRKEYEARDLFHAAEFEWRDPEKLGEAVEKYRMILRDYLGTSIALNNMVVITKRSEAGKDYVLLPDQMKASGAFRRGKFEPVPEAWTLPRGVSGAEERTTYVEAGFYALAGTSYRGWAWLGGCCVEAFTVHYQTTEGKARDPRTQKEYVLEPDGPVAMPLDHRIRMLRSRHASHGGEKGDLRWEWVPLPIPEAYAAPGRKVFRFLATQEGFSVALVVFSSVCDRPPDRDETAAMVAPGTDSSPKASGRTAPRPPPALAEIWKVLVANRSNLAGKTAAVKLKPPFDKAKAVVDDVTDSELKMSAAFGGGRAGVTKKSGEFDAGELKGLLDLAGVAITPELEERLASLDTGWEKARAEAALAAALEAARGRMARKDWKGAIAILEDALRLKPGDPEAAKLLAEAEGRLSPKSLALDIGGGVTMEFVYLKPGTFVMGGECATEGRFDAVEVPKHKVTITRGFCLGKYEVTQAQYEAVMGTNPSKSTRDPNCPADNVSWDQANEFCRRVAQKTGLMVRLPTEAEWEYACRAGTDTDWSHGGDPAELGEYAWFAGNAGGGSHPVGQKKPNPWGLYDMHGNVCERVADLYHRDYYASSPKEDPTGAKVGVSFGANGTTIMRGGTWKCDAGACRSGHRLRGGGYGVYHNWGLRAALTPREEGGMPGR